MKTMTAHELETWQDAQDYAEVIKQHNRNTELEGDKMNLTDLAHQCYADNKAWFPEKANDLVHHALGLAGEAGEVANWIKKIDRGTHSLDAGKVRKEIGEEVVDVLIYALSLCAILGINPDEMWKVKRAFNQKRFGKKEDTDVK
jgi:NTP pyrophosphatase (non-canonical NTP hydrolase)